MSSFKISDFEIDFKQIGTTDYQIVLCNGDRKETIPLLLDPSIVNRLRTTLNQCPKLHNCKSFDYVYKVVAGVAMTFMKGGFPA